MRALLRELAVALVATLAWSFGSPAPAQTAPAPAQEVLVLVRLPPEHYRPGAAYGAGYADDLARQAERRLGDASRTRTV